MTLSFANVLTYIRQMPEPPKAAIQAINMLEDPNVPVAKSAEFIAMDETLTAKLLRLSNSAYYGFSGKVTTVNEAIIRLGVNVVKCALYASMMDMSGMKVSGFFIELWQSALHTAILSKELAVMMNHPRKDQCFTAGLLCDLGQILLNDAAQNQQEGFYASLLQAVRENRMDVAAAERELWGFTHCDVGAKLAEMWHLPAKYESCIRLHHSAEQLKGRIQQEDYKLMLIVATANQLSPLFSANYAAAQINFAELKRSGLPCSTQTDLIERLAANLSRREKEIKVVTEAMFGQSLALAR